MNTRTILSLLVTTLSLGCVGAPDDDGDLAIRSGQALTYSGVTLSAPILRVGPVQVASATITGFSTARAAAGTRISLRGTSFERNRQGRLTLNGLGYQVSFAGLNGARVAAVNPVMLSSTELAVTVPAGAGTGRVRLSDALGTLSESPTDFVVPTPPPPPAPTRVRVTNNNQYDLVTLVINGTPLVSCANPLAPGASIDVNVMPGGFGLAGVLGYCDRGTPTSIPPAALEFQGAVQNGQTFTVFANPFTLGELLTNWGFNSGEWASGIFVDARGNFRQSSYIFDANAAWRGLEFGTEWGRGQAQLLSWPQRAACVRFTLGPDHPVTETCLPFSSFTLDGNPHVRR